MLYSSLLFAAAALTGFVSAQNNDTSANPNLPPGVQNCCQVNPSDVPEKKRNEWCQAERNTCPEICGGINQLATTGQKCDTTTLEYTCECRNGTKPKMEEYEQSVPGQMCRFWYDACIAATGENLEQQFECKKQRDEKCGTKISKDTGSASSSSSASATATGTGSSSSDKPTSTGTNSASSTVPTGAGAVSYYSTPMLVGGIAAFFGLAL